jgi:hypothetical protein
MAILDVSRAGDLEQLRAAADRAWQAQRRLDRVQAQLADVSIQTQLKQDELLVLRQHHGQAEQSGPVGAGRAVRLLLPGGQRQPAHQAGAQRHLQLTSQIGRCQLELAQLDQATGRLRTQALRLRTEAAALPELLATIAERVESTDDPVSRQVRQLAAELTPLEERGTQLRSAEQAVSQARNELEHALSDCRQQFQVSELGAAGAVLEDCASTDRRRLDELVRWLVRTVQSAQLAVGRCQSTLAQYRVEVYLAGGSGVGQSNRLPDLDFNLAACAAVASTNSGARYQLATALAASEQAASFLLQLQLQVHEGYWANQQALLQRRQRHFALLLGGIGVDAGADQLWSGWAG